MAPTFDAVAAVVREQTNYTGPLTADTALQADLGVYGDDLDRLVLAWAERFGADLSGYVPYFHTPEEGWNFGAWFFPPPAEIPITVGMLHDFAVRGRWACDYPEGVGRGRPDVWVNRALAAAAVGALVWWWVW